MIEEQSFDSTFECQRRRFYQILCTYTTNSLCNDTRYRFNLFDTFSGQQKTREDFHNHLILVAPKTRVFFCWKFPDLK